MTELFNIDESLSPREAWLRRHNVTTEFDHDDGEWHALDPRRPEIIGTGRDEEAALFELARQHGWKWFNEEYYNV
jgi:hypothetical protein